MILWKKTNETLGEDEICLIMRDCLLGVKFIHDMKRIHRDIKSGNVLLASDGKAKLADFGVTAEWKDYTKHHSLTGSPYWLAPEVIEENYNHKCDIWSLGITAIEMAEGEPPLHDQHLYRLIHLIRINPPPTLTEKDKWSPEFNDFVYQCLTRDPEQRPSAMQLLLHPFIHKSHSIDPQIILNLIDKSFQAVVPEKSKKKDDSSDTSDSILDLGDMLLDNSSKDIKSELIEDDSKFGSVMIKDVNNIDIKNSIDDTSSCGTFVKYEEGNVKKSKEKIDDSLSNSKKNQLQKITEKVPDQKSKKKRKKKMVQW